MRIIVFGHAYTCFWPRVYLFLATRILVLATRIVVFGHAYTCLWPRVYLFVDTRILVFGHAYTCFWPRVYFLSVDDMMLSVIRDEIPVYNVKTGILILQL